MRYTERKNEKRVKSKKGKVREEKGKTREKIRKAKKRGKGKGASVLTRRKAQTIGDKRSMLGVLSGRMETHLFS